MNGAGPVKLVHVKILIVLHKHTKLSVEFQIMHRNIREERVRERESRHVRQVETILIEK